jgi:outer membrane biosynthesis protein TonB
MSQLERRMKSALPATISLITSGAIHVLVFVAVARSASGAEPASEELAPARFVGNTFEIDTVDVAPVAARDSPRAPPAPAAPAEPSLPPAPAPRPAPPAEKALDVPDEPAPTIDSATVLPQPPSAPTPTPPAAESPQAASSPPAQGAQSPGAPATDAAQATTTGGVGPSYGQDALPASTASLAKAFTRAVPRIASSDKVWHGLPIGAAGKAVFSIEIDAGGKLVGQGRVLDEPAPAPHLERIIGRTVLLLRSQTFAVPGEAGGVQHFELSAEIRQVGALEDTFAEPQDLRQIGRLVEPTRVRPGKANFTYNSGRQVELTLRLLAQ